MMRLGLWMCLRSCERWDCLLCFTSTKADLLSPRLWGLRRTINSRGQPPVLSQWRSSLATLLIPMLSVVDSQHTRAHKDIMCTQNGTHLDWAPLFPGAWSRFSVYQKRVGVVQLSSLALPPFLFSPLFSSAAARRQEQNEQTGFLPQLSCDHFPTAPSFPPINSLTSPN